MSLEPVIWSEVREKQKSYVNAYIQNLEKWYWWTYFQGRNRVADTENRLVGTLWEEEGGMNWESSMKYVYYHG